MSLENNVKDIISKKLEDGTIEKIIEEQLENGVQNAMQNLFRSYGDVTQVIEKKIKSVMVPYLENYDYSEYIVKLDHVLVDVLNHSALENKQLLENFRSLMVENPKEDIKLSTLYEHWMKYVAKHVSTDDLEVCLEDGPSYENVNVSLEVEYGDERSWLKIERATIIFECEEDEDMNFAIPVHRFTDISQNWTIDYKTGSDLKSLRHLNEFEVYLMKLTQGFNRLEIDTNWEDDEVTPDAEPEASFY